jgi:hypothetical protein
LLGPTTVPRSRSARVGCGIQIHLVPMLLGAGVRLFDHLGTEYIDLVIMKVVASPGGTHLRFRVVQ